MADTSRKRALDAAASGEAGHVRFEIQSGELAFLWAGEAALGVALNSGAPGDPWEILPREFSDWQYPDGREDAVDPDELPMILEIVGRELTARGVDYRIVEE